jgi:hypothetical protein
MAFEYMLLIKLCRNSIRSIYKAAPFEKNLLPFSTKKNTL